MDLQWGDDDDHKGWHLSITFTTMLCVADGEVAIYSVKHCPWKTSLLSKKVYGSYIAIDDTMSC